MNSTEKVFYDTLKEETGLEGPFLVAFSGGSDSLALLIMCSKLLPRGCVYPVYVNHRIRKKPEIESEIELNCLNCDMLHLPLEIIDLGEDSVSELADAKKCGVEAAARALRYGALEKKREEFSCRWILTAHHFDDQIETVAMKMMTKAPIPSLRGIAPVIGNIARPFLKLRKHEIRNYVSECGFSWCEDSTNKDNRYLRNYVRNVYIPQKIHDDSSFEKKVLDTWKNAVSECSNAVYTNSEVIDIIKFLSLDEGSQILMLFRVWNACFKDFRAMPQTLISRIMQACQTGKDGIIEANGARIEIYRGSIYISDISKDSDYESFDIAIDTLCTIKQCLPGGYSLISEKDMESYDRNPGVIYLCSSSFDGEVHLRYVRTGDTIFLKNGKKKVLKMLQDMKIPSSLRKRVPLLYDDKGICTVFGSLYGGSDRIASRMYHSLAEDNEYKYYIQAYK